MDFELRYWVKPHREFMWPHASAASTLIAYPTATPYWSFSRIIIFVEGRLKHDLHLRLVNGFMPDGVQNVYYPEEMAVQLWHLPSDTHGVIESDVLAAYTRGLPFTFTTTLRRRS